MLKSDLHLHCSADPKDSISYSDKDLIDHAVKFNFNLLSITCHDLQHYPSEIVKYAKKKGILLISGMEKTIQGKHILLYNFEQKELDKIKKLTDITKYKTTDNLVICPHPFLPLPSSLLWNFKKYLHLFDAVEYCHFYTNITNHNLITKQLTNLPFVGNSDAHFLSQMNYTYSLINAKLEISKVITAIKENQIKVHSTPLPHLRVIKHVSSFISGKVNKSILGKHF